jgi:phospholipase C
MQKLVATSLATLMISSQIAGPVAVRAQSYGSTATPIKHVVVIFGENISFDHYFGSYPNALNPGNEPKFYAKPGTPSVNGFNDALLYSNPNLLNKAPRIPFDSIARKQRPRIRITTTRRSSRHFTAA